MRLLFLLLVTLGLSTSVSAQSSAPSAALSSASSAQEPSLDLPVSLDRIRDQMSVPDARRLRNVDVKADFSVHIEEQRHIDEILSTLDFRTGPAPAGGLYAYEQQRMLFNPTSNPLQQPYAAYSAGQFFTIAAENLIGKYLVGSVARGISAARRSAAEEAARREVRENITAFCAARSDAPQIPLCNTPRAP
ncbi:MAG: hypothetical protein QM736_25900 [Vicinamibacterales bacterium]